ncbi:hypothetical protein Tco_1388695, partial [Tanacetum coccineum]
MNQNFYNSNSSGFDQFQPPQFLVIHQPPQETSVEILQAKEDLMISIETFLKKFNRISFRETPNVLLLAWDKFFEIKHREKQHPPEDIQELIRKLLEDVQNISEELAEYINSSIWNRPAFYFEDDDDEESSIPVRDIISELPLCVAITPDLSITDSLIMEDEHLDTILKKEESSVENLVPIPCEYEDLSVIESECDVPVSTTFSNPLFDADDDFSSSDNEPFSEEDVPKEIYSNPLFDSLLEDFSGELTILKSIPPGIDETDFDPEEDIHLSFSPSPIPVEDSDSLMEEIDLFLTPDDSMPLGIKNDGYDSEGDILFLEELLSNDSPSLPKNESFYFDISLSPRPPTKLLDDGIYFEPDTGFLTAKVVGDTSEHYVRMPRLLPTQPTLCRVIDTLLPFSSENEDKVHLLSHRG